MLPRRVRRRRRSAAASSAQAVEGGGFNEGGAIEGEAGRHPHPVDLPVLEKFPVVQAVKGVERGHDAAVSG